MSLQVSDAVDLLVIAAKAAPEVARALRGAFEASDDPLAPQIRARLPEVGASEAALQRVREGTSRT